MSKLITINSSNPELFYASEHETYGGVSFNLQASYELIDMFNWYKNERARIEQEGNFRNMYPAVEEAYAQYNTLLKLVTDISWLQ